jgi:hypothetical protein
VQIEVSLATKLKYHRIWVRVTSGTVFTAKNLQTSWLYYHIGMSGQMLGSLTFTEALNALLVNIVPIMFV